MKATGHVLFDPYGLNPRTNWTSFSVYSSRGADYIGDSNCLRRSASQQLLSDDSGAGLLGARSPPYSLSPSCSSSIPPWLVVQPPLPPVPLSKSASLPSPSPPASIRRAVGQPAENDLEAKKLIPAKAPKDSQSGGGQRRKDLVGAAPPADVPETASSFKFVMPEEEDDFAGYIYSLSPPPSSLPMPKFSLRARMDSETLCGGGDLVNGVAYGGASADLRRLLRL